MTAFHVLFVILWQGLDLLKHSILNILLINIINRSVSLMPSFKKILYDPWRP